jgi:hypothetical protein
LTIATAEVESMGESNITDEIRERLYGEAKKELIAELNK